MIDGPSERQRDILYSYYWRSCFNKTSKLRISLEDFNAGCLEVNYEGDSSTCYKELCSEKASHGLSRKDGRM